MTRTRRSMLFAIVTLIAIGLSATAVFAQYPVTIEHKYGSTTIRQRPERIVLVGLTEQDALLALGIVPVATREWYGQRPGALFPWAIELLGDAPLPVVLGAELDFEQVAALSPDVIIGLYSGITPSEYAILSRIAPTVAQPAEYVDWGIPWQELTITIGRIVGQEERARQLVADVEAKFAKAREEHPEFQGKQAAVLSSWGMPQNFYVYGSQDARGRFLTSLGFVIPEALDRVAGGAFGGSMSREELHRLGDLDVAIWFARRETLKEDPLYRSLRVSREERDIYLDTSSSVYDAFNFSTVLSLPYALERLAPSLSQAVQGAGVPVVVQE